MWESPTFKATQPVAQTMQLFIEQSVRAIKNKMVIICFICFLVLAKFSYTIALDPITPFREKPAHVHSIMDT